jgi:2-phospho-L-lactate guanylyltransferase
MRAIVLPVKSLEDTKSRLAPVLSPMERAALTLAMLEDVLDASLVAPGWTTWVVSPDEAVLEVAVARGAISVPEVEGPLETALGQTDEAAAGRGLDALAVLLPDTPMVTPSALVRALHVPGPVVMAAAADGIGTNLLIRRPPTAIPPCFGPDSARRHRRAAGQVGLPVVEITIPELAFDLDAPDDILTVLRHRRDTRTGEVLRALEVEERMSARTAGA